MRKEQDAACRGSQRWLQIAVNRCPDVIDSAISQALCLPDSEDIEWRSPLECDGFAEYRDGQFLDRLGVSLACRPLKDFWPKMGPQWDGLARTSNGRLLLVEAKANIPEFDSSPTGATGDSLKKIKAALAEIKEFLGVKSKTDWSRCFYQYANRLAHLYLLRELNCLDAYLVFVYFVDDRTRPDECPVSRKEWEAAISLATNHLGIPRSHPWVSKNVVDVFIDVDALSHVPWPPAQPCSDPGPLRQ